MKNLSICLIYLFSSLMILTAQTTEYELASAIQSTDSYYLHSDIYRTTSETYAKLSWEEGITSGDLTLELRDRSTQKISIHIPNNNKLVLNNLPDDTNYDWRLKITEDGESDVTSWVQFTTAYQSPIKATKAVSDAMKNWKKNMDKYDNIEQYIMAQIDISMEDRLTFVMNFYKGVPPSLNAGVLLGGGDGDGCNCDFVVFDNVDQGSPEFVEHEDDDDVYCGEWDRDGSYTERHGAAKDMQLHLDGRLKESQSQNYEIAKFVSYTNLTVQYCCDTDDCCDAEYTVGARYDHELYGFGKYSNKGGYSVMAADVAFVAEVIDGEINLMGEPMANALEVAEETTTNWDFWYQLIDLVALGLGTYEEIIDLDADAIEEFLDQVIAVISTNTVNHEYDSNGNSITDILKVSPVKRTIGANEIANYYICSNSALAYNDAWGKKFWCNKGDIETDGHVKSGYSIAISSIYKNDPNDECCRADYAKWVTGSYIANGANAQNMIAEAGAVVGCNDGEWISNGVNIQCPNSNTALPGAIGIATADNDCCEGGAVDPNFDVSYECVEWFDTTEETDSFGGDDDGPDKDGGDGDGPDKDDDGGPVIDGEDGPDKDTDVPGGPIKDCTTCKRAKITVSIPGCPDDANHAFTILEVNPYNGNTSIIWWDNDVDVCEFSVEITTRTCRTYKISHTVVGECSNETQVKTLFTTCCKVIIEPPHEEDEPDYPGEGMTDDNTPSEEMMEGDLDVEVRFSESVIDNQLTVYPNPAINQVMFDTNVEEGTLEIYNINGKKITSKIIRKGSSVILDNATLGTGTYIARLNSNGLVTTQKFIIL